MGQERDTARKLAIPELWPDRGPESWAEGAVGKMTETAWCQLYFRLMKKSVYVIHMSRPIFPSYPIHFGLIGADL